MHPSFATPTRFLTVLALAAAAVLTPRLAPAAAGSGIAPPDIHDPVWAPDGDRVLFYANPEGHFEVYELDLASGEVARRTHSSGSSGPAWAPDGRRFSFHSDRDGDSELFVVELPDGPPRQITHNDTPDVAHAWLPDGSAIVFEARRGDNHDLYRIDLTSGEETRLTEHPANDFRPAPCGERLVFQSKRSGRYQLHARLPDGSVEALTDLPGHAASPDCASRSGRIAFVHHVDGRSTLELLEPDGTVRPLRPGGLEGLAPSWSPDEGRLVAYGERDGAAALLVVEVDGEGEQVIRPFD